MPDWGPLGDWANKGLGGLEEGADWGKEKLGEGVDWTTDRIGDGLDYVDAEDAADAVEDWGDRTAASLGAEVGEQQLGKTEDANELVHGSPSTIREKAKHLFDFQVAFDRVGQGMKRLDSSHWKGEAAEAFRDEFAMHPADWLHAADACESAAKALGAYADTVKWAQDKAKEAIDLYKEGREASAKAVDAHQKKVDNYETLLKAGEDPGPRPGTLSDPGMTQMERAQEILDDARRQRNDAAETAKKAVSAALAHAPAEPPPLERAVNDFITGRVAAGVELAHVVGGVAKGAGGLVNFVRGVNPLDPYNLTHPAEYYESINTTLAGLAASVAHPDRTIKNAWDGLKNDPSEFLGRLIPELIGTKGSGLGRAGLRAGLRNPGVGSLQRLTDEWLTGARRRPRDLLDDPEQTRWAEQAYANFLEDSRDIDAIAQGTHGVTRADGSTGFTAEEIAAVKKHVFDTEHPIEDYETGQVVMRKFDADAEIADAWIRLRSGNALPEDHLLLEHEVAELTYLRENPGATYQEAHRVANEKYNWQEQVPLNKREDMEGDW
ncbi:putative T7SS-secreted protein [Streptomyces sp. SYSU K217416]